MRFGLDIAQHQLTWAEIRDRALLAEGSGFEGAWVFDHFQPLYGDPSGPCLEAWTLLAALAAETERIRLGTLVTGVTYRHPSVLAAQILTVDHVSNGRLDVGIGAAWFEDEHVRLGIPFPSVGERIDRLIEALDVIDALLTRRDVTFGGDFYQLEHATLGPRPVQRPRPPFWIGAGGPARMLPLVGREADVWHSFGDADQIRDKGRIVDSAAVDAGRDPGDVMWSSSLSIEDDWDTVRAQVESYACVGVEYLVVGWPSGGTDRVGAFVGEAMDS